MTYAPARHHPGLNLSVAVIICTRNRNALLERCLRSIGRLRRAPERVLVVDNAPDTGAVPAIASRYGADYLLAEQPGLSKARNCGARASREDILAYADDDMIVHPDWLSSLLAGFADARVMGVTGPFVPLDMQGKPDAEIASALAQLPWGAVPFKIDRTCAGWFERANFGGIGDGNFAIRRAAFDRWHGFDERLGRGMPLDMGEEHYAFFELLLCGHSLAYSPRAIVFHPSRHYTGEEASALLAQSIAYAGFVAFQKPQYAPRIAKYLAERTFHRRRPWRNWRHADHAPGAERIPTMRALFDGIRILGDCYKQKR